jgi:hypothetical protein
MSSNVLQRYNGQTLIKNDTLNQLQISQQFKLPYISSSNLPPAFLTPTGGGIAFDVVSKTIWYCNGSVWQPVAASLPPGNAESFSFIKGMNSGVPSNTDTVLTGWTTAGSPAYSTIAQWNLGTGEYTATGTEYLYISVNVEWLAGISNLGTRRIRVEYKPSGGVWDIIAESKTQASPDQNIETTQTTGLSLYLSPGDQARVTVFHNAPLGLQIAGGINTYLSGLRLGA